MSYSGPLVFKLCYEQPQASLRCAGAWVGVSLTSASPALRFDTLGYHEGFCLGKQKGVYCLSRQLETTILAFSCS